MRNIIIVLILVLILAAGFIFFKPKPTPVIQNVTSTPSITSAPKVIAENLDTPWGIVFLPDNSMLVTERSGRVRLVDNKGKLQEEPVATIKEVKEIGEGGLLGITLHPDFSKNAKVFLYYTYSSSGGNTLNRVVSMVYDGSLKDEQIIVDQIPGASNHNGGRIKFGPDGFLYITTGDAQNPSQAQDINALGGKILRVTDGGKAAPGNPFNNLVYSYGHRNPQGLAWDFQGRLWATEHGRSGIQSGLDELNLIEPGKNYGWPIIQGSEKREGMVTPVANSGPDKTWAPAGAAFWQGSIYFGGLRGQTLYQAVIDQSQVSVKEHFKDEFGRIREVILGPDNMLYITTSNKDGRGTPNPSDDRIIKINPR